ncbi:hypothetical protein WJX79_005179 [Trebouxia sp. C0005]
MLLCRRRAEKEEQKACQATSNPQFTTAFRPCSAVRFPELSGGELNARKNALFLSACSTVYLLALSYPKARFTSAHRDPLKFLGLIA